MLTDGTCVLQATSDLRDLFTLLRHENAPLFDLMTKFSRNCGASNPKPVQQLEWLSDVVQMQRNRTSEYLMAKFSRNCDCAGFLAGLVGCQQIANRARWSNHLKSEARFTPMNSNGKRQLNRKTTATAIPPAFFLAS